MIHLDTIGLKVFLFFFSSNNLLLQVYTVITEILQKCQSFSKQKKGYNLEKKGILNGAP